jgi:peptide/nickel transport system substrate-binding protein
MVPNEPNLQLNRVAGLAYNVLQLNPSRPPMDNLKVRQAMSCAIDRQEIIDAALAGEGKVTGPLTMPAFAQDPDTLFCYKQDLDKAKQLMAESGVNGFTAKVIAATGEPPVSASEAQVLQAQLAEIGVKLEIEMMELNRYFTKDGNLLKVSNFVDDTLDTLMKQGQAETDPAKRVEIFHQFENHLVEQSPWLWLSTGYGYTAQLKTVSGFVPSPTGTLFGLTDISIQ